MISCQGEPFAGASIYAQFKVFEEARKNGVTVILDGQGADELLAGYEGYEINFLESLLDKKKFATFYNYILLLRNRRKYSLQRCFSIFANSLLSKYLKGLQKRISEKKMVHPEWIDMDFFSKQELLANYPPTHVADINSSGRRLMEKLRDDLTESRISRLLRYADRNAMFHSIENRVPFLTTPIANFNLSLPENFIMSDSGDTKYIFREAMKGIVPEEILERTDKIGFSTPEQKWFKYLIENIDGKNELFEKTPGINKRTSQLIMDKIITNDEEYQPDMWRMMNFCLWKEYLN